MSKSTAVTTIVNDVAVAGGAGTTITSSRDLSSAVRTCYHLWIENNITNGPTTAGQITVETSPDNDSDHFAQYGAALKGNTTAAGERSWTITIPPEVKYARFTYGGNVGGGDVTFRIIETIVTSF